MPIVTLQVLSIRVYDMAKSMLTWLDGTLPQAAVMANVEALLEPLR